MTKVCSQPADISTATADLKWAWASWEYTSAHCTFDLHTKKAELARWHNWLGSKPHLKRTDGKFNLNQKKALLFALALGMVIRDVEAAAFIFDPDEPPPNHLPDYVRDTRIEVREVEDIILPLCEKVTTAIADLSNPPPPRSSTRDRKQTKRPDAESSTLPDPPAGTSKRVREPRSPRKAQPPKKVKNARNP